MYTVVLLRGKKSSVQWEHKDKKSAMRRAWALSDLHASCPIYEDEDGKKIVVDGSEWYRK